jgi:hypothetical protein
LPDEPRELALKRCFFVAIGGDDHGGFFVSPESLAAGADEPRSLVVLNSSWKLVDFQSAVLTRSLTFGLATRTLTSALMWRSTRTRPLSRYAPGAFQASGRSRIREAMTERRTFRHLSGTSRRGFSIGAPRFELGTSCPPDCSGRWVPSVG